MTTHDLVTAALVALAVLQTAWCVVYASGAWRSTPLGWVWLLKGACLALLWWMLLADQITNIPEAAFGALGVVLVVATAMWLRVTVKARFGRYAPYL